MSDSYKELGSEYLMRDGVSQKQRTSKALSPTYVSVDERSAEDMLQFIQKFSEKLKFYDLDGTVTNWSSFLTNSQNQTENEKADPKVVNKRIKELASYLEKETFPSDPNLLTRPHLALLLCFLKLLSHTRRQINTITKKHLDFYYTEALGLKSKKAVPDKVNVIVKLLSEAGQLLLPAGTKLDAGNDSLGKPLVYATDKEIVLNQAKIGAIKSLYVEKQITGVRDIHFRNDNPDEAFIQILQLVLADPWPNDKLPLFPDGQEVNIAFIKGLKNLKKDLAWIDTNLFMSFYDFIFIMQTSGSSGQSDDQWNKVHAIIEAAGGRKHSNAGFTIRERTKNKTTFDANINTAVGPISFTSIPGIKSLDDFYIKKIRQIEDYFSLSALEVAIVMDVQATIKPPDVRHRSINEWNQVYELLETAYSNKARKHRIVQLKNQKEKEGFTAMFTVALGTINPGDAQPVLSYSLDELYNDRKDVRKQEYITSELYLEENEFSTIMDVQYNSKSTEMDWNKAYSLIEKAQRKKNMLLDLPPEREEIFNIYKADDATKITSSEVYEDKNTKSSWPLFGVKQSEDAVNMMTPAEIGFAISSPVLILTQGIRTITATLDFHSAGFDSKVLEDILNKEPFLFYLQDKNGYMLIKANAARIGAFAAGPYEQEYAGATLNAEKNTITLGKDNVFGNDDLGKWIVWGDGTIFKIAGFPDKTKATVIASGSTASHTGVKKYGPDSICFNAIQFEFVLSEKDRAIEAFAKDEAGFTQWPALTLVLNNIYDSNAEKSSIYYQAFKQLQIEQVYLSVKVSDMKDFLCQSDESEITPTKPFEPFGAQPSPGSGFYFGHQEIAMKRLDNLSLSFNWMGVPDNLQDYYKNYYSENNSITGNAVFQADVKLNDRGFTVALGSVNLFAGDKQDAQKVNEVTLANISRLVHNAYPNYSYETEASLEEEDKELPDWDKYFKLELKSPDFQHSRYSVAAFEKSMKLSRDLSADPKMNPNMADYTVNPPYTPKLKSLNLGYTASAVIPAGSDASGLFHIHPFGAGTLPKEDTNTCFFLPQYNEEGALYIGLDEATAAQEISMLFQLAESSANPDVAKPSISWAFLVDNQWVPFDDNSIRSDDTNSLSNTGNIVFKLPENLNNRNTLLEKGKHWLRASVTKNADGVGKAIALHTQTISATFIDQDNATDHLLNPLPPDSITKTVDDIPEIESITQPYTSVNGSTKEQDEHFYRRVSERLRHKNRALTVWDYEHIVLENFPDIYKVKCMPAMTLKEAGTITLVLIPDIINKLPANPFEPKVPSNRLEEVKRYLEKYNSPYVSLIVKNPKYMVVKVRVGVAFKSGNEGYFKDLLNKELQKFLAPWAYTEGADITLGGKIYANNIVNFIETRDYINYVSHIKLFSSTDGTNFTQAIVSDKEPENAVSALEPDVILVSSRHHDIDIIENNNYSDINFSGIEYMKVELDFRVE